MQQIEEPDCICDHCEFYERGFELSEDGYKMGVYDKCTLNGKKMVGPMPRYTYYGAEKDYGNGLYSQFFYNLRIVGCPKMTEYNKKIGRYIRVLHKDGTITKEY